MFELAGPRSVQTEVALQGDGHVHPGRYVHKGTAGPNSPVQSCKLVVRRRNQLHEMGPYNIFVLFQCRIKVGVDHALLYQFILDAVVHHFGVVLGANPCQRGLFCFGNTQPVKGIFDFVRHIVPAAFIWVLGRT